MGPLRIERVEEGVCGAWVWFEPGFEPVFVSERRWVGFDFDGTIARDDAPGHFDPPYPLGKAIPEMLQTAKSLITAGVKVKIFTARACEPECIPQLQDWAEQHGLGRLEVTNCKDYDLIRFFDDRAIQVLPNEARIVRSAERSAPGPAAEESAELQA